MVILGSAAHNAIIFRRCKTCQRVQVRVEEASHRKKDGAIRAVPLGR